MTDWSLYDVVSSPHMSAKLWRRKCGKARAWLAGARYALMVLKSESPTAKSLELACFQIARPLPTAGLVPVCTNYCEGRRSAEPNRAAAHQQQGVHTYLRVV